MMDTYHNLTLKVKMGIKWTVENTNAKWILKCDDDVWADIRGLEEYLKELDHTKPYLIGRIKGDVPRSTAEDYMDERWIDNKYNGTIYPKYADGAAGYVISRAVAEYIASNFNKLENYVLEDASMGIWIDESPLKNAMHYVQDYSRFKNSANGGPKKCLRPGRSKNQTLVYGHKLGHVKMEKCHQLMTKLYNLTQFQ